jgi:hypothetical protein
VAARQGLLLGIDSNYVDPASLSANGQPGTDKTRTTEFPQAGRRGGPAGLGQLQDHYHQNDDDQDANDEPNDSTVHFSSFDSHAEVILATRPPLCAHPVRASTFLR